MKRKFIVAGMAMGLSLSSCFTSLAAEPVKVSPGNVININVVDKEDNPVNGIGISIKNSAGVEVAEVISGQSAVSKNNSGIVAGAEGSTFNIPRNVFE